MSRQLRIAFISLFLLAFFPVTHCWAAWGMGLAKEPWGAVFVSALSPNSAMRDAGLQVGSYIYEIDGFGLTDLSVEQCVSMLGRAEKNGSITLSWDLPGARHTRLSSVIKQSPEKSKHPSFFHIGEFRKPKPLSGFQFRPLTQDELNTFKKADAAHISPILKDGSLPDSAWVMELAGTGGLKLVDVITNIESYIYVLGRGECKPLWIGGYDLVKKYADISTEAGAAALLDATLIEWFQPRTDKPEYLHLFRKLSSEENELLSTALPDASLTKLSNGEWEAKVPVLWRVNVKLGTYRIAPDKKVRVIAREVLVTGLPVYDQLQGHRGARWAGYFNYGDTDWLRHVKVALEKMAPQQRASLTVLTTRDIWNMKEPPLAFQFQVRDSSTGRLISAVPQMSASYLNGRAFESGDLGDQAVIYYFFGTYCKPCTDYIPDINALSSWIEKNRINAKVFAVGDTNEDRSVVEPYVRENAVAVDVLLDSKGQLTESFNLEAIPAVVVVIDGKVKLLEVGSLEAQRRSTMQQTRALLTEFSRR